MPIVPIVPIVPIEPIERGAGAEARRAQEQRLEAPLERDIECVVLARAVHRHVGHPVLINGHPRVVLR